MALNWVWIGFFVTACATAVVRWWLGDEGIFTALLAALFDGARAGFEIALGLAGIMALWLGLMRVGEQAGMIALLARVAAPLLRKLFPGVPQGHPAQGAMTMNISANLLGLDNAATPLGLTAMRELQTLNREPPGTASDAQIMFVVMNTAGLTLIPTSVIAIRQSVALKQGLGAGFNAADIFLPTLLATFISLLAGVLAVAVVQRLPLWRARLAVPLLAVAGLQGPLPFARRALARVHALTGGVPRRINLLCDRALLGAYAAGVREVSARIVQRAALVLVGLQLAPGLHVGVSLALLVLGGLLVLVAGQPVEEVNQPLAKIAEDLGNALGYAVQGAGKPFIDVVQAGPVVGTERVRGVVVHGRCSCGRNFRGRENRAPGGHSKAGFWSGMATYSTRIRAISSPGIFRKP